MDPKRVLTFRAVANHRSFTRAAEELALSQPSVSHQVAALEREIGARLLDRRPGGLQLTPAGALLLEHADAIAVRFDLAALQLAEIADDERTLLRIGAFPTALAGFVPSAVAGVRAAHPSASAHPGGTSRSATHVSASAVDGSNWIAATTTAIDNGSTSAHARVRNRSAHAGRPAAGAATQAACAATSTRLSAENQIARFYRVASLSACAGCSA